MIAYYNWLRRYFKHFFAPIEQKFFKDIAQICIKQNHLTGSPNFIYQNHTERYGSGTYHKLHSSLVREYLDYRQSLDKFSKDKLFVYSYLSALPSVIQNKEDLQIYLPSELHKNLNVKFIQQSTTLKPDYEKFHSLYFYYKLLQEL